MRTRHLLVALSLLSCAAPARAELVFFSNGRSLSVKDHRADGQSLVLMLRNGGEVVFDASLVTRIVPDEAPYPEPVSAPAPAVLEVAVDSPAAAAMPDAAAPYPDMIDRAAAKQGVPARLVHAVIQVESGYQTRARSSKGAMGLMQLMPATARQYAVANPYDPAANIDAGVRHLKSLLARFPTALALAAYNAGEAAVERFHGIPPYAETRSYVSRILQLAGLS